MARKGIKAQSIVALLVFLVIGFSFLIGLGRDVDVEAPVVIVV